MGMCHLKVLIFFFPHQEIGMTHLRIVDGVTTLLQLTGLLAKCCQAALEATGNI
jgi:hypothetical protein